MELVREEYRGMHLRRKREREREMDMSAWEAPLQYPDPNCILVV
jgi:hypothetical protein